MSKVAELSFEPAIGKFGDVYGKSGDKITIWLKTLSGRRIELKVGSQSYVEEIKYLLEEHEGIPVDNDRLVLLYKNKRIQDGCRISDYGVAQAVMKVSDTYTSDTCCCSEIVLLRLQVK